MEIIKLLPLNTVILCFILCDIFYGSHFTEKKSIGQFFKCKPSLTETKTLYIAVISNSIIYSF